ncbi:MAG: hypothetical protein ACXVA9_09055 [Bdellovibrionales bacterium]
MKSLVIALLFSSISAHAGQSITCHQLTKSGAVKANGGTVKLNLEYKLGEDVSKTKSTVSVTGFTKDKSNTELSSLTIRAVNQSEPKSGKAYTVFFFDNPNGMLDIQLQFDARVLNEDFNGEKAEFVIGSEDANPETGFAFGYPVVCNGRLK